MTKPIHKMTIRKRYRFYRQWHNRFYAAANSIDIVPLFSWCAVIGFVLGLVWSYLDD
jgi:hypothetical protein